MTSQGANVPSPRYQHTAVWTGTQMVVWGGLAQGDVNTRWALYEYLASRPFGARPLDANGNGNGK